MTIRVFKNCETDFRQLIGLWNLMPTQVNILLISVDLIEMMCVKRVKENGICFAHPIQDGR